MSKISKSERIRQLALAAKLEAVQDELVEIETYLAGITATINQIVCQIVEEGAEPLK